MEGLVRVRICLSWLGVNGGGGGVGLECGLTLCVCVFVGQRGKRWDKGCKGAKRQLLGEERLTESFCNLSLGS